MDKKMANWINTQLEKMRKESEKDVMKPIKIEEDIQVKSN